MTHKEAKKGYPSVFTAVHYDTKITVEKDHSDLDLDEVMDIFQTLIMGMGYHDDAFKNWVIERADEYRETESKDFEEKLNGWKFDDEDIEVPHSNEHWNEEKSDETFDWESDYFGAADVNEDEYNPVWVNGDEDEFANEALIIAAEKYKALLEETEKYKTKKRGWITQKLLDFVDKIGAASYTELDAYYKTITGGHNSFSHHLENLKVPYKNRVTRRYLVKDGSSHSNAKYIVKIANPSNWVELDLN